MKTTAAKILRRAASGPTLLAFGLLLAGTAAAQDGRRQLDAHSHGEGRLAIAIEGNRLQMELDAPAADIVGFEHAPSTAKQHKTIADAAARLTKLTELITPSPEAGCAVTEAKVDLTGLAPAKAVKGHAHNHGHKGHSHGHDKPKDQAKAGAAEEHAEFRAVYTLECTTPASLKSLAFGYFKAFKGAEKLVVTMIGPKGQSSFEVTRKKPVLDLGGIT